MLFLPLRGPTSLANITSRSDLDRQPGIEGPVLLRIRIARIPPGIDHDARGTHAIVETVVHVTVNRQHRPGFIEQRPQLTDTGPLKPIPPVPRYVPPRANNTE